MPIVRKKKPEGFKGYHWHHLVPRYMGGDDSDDNLILLSPHDHALAHLELYQKYNRQADAWAYNRLIRQSNLKLDEIKYIKPNLGKKFSEETNRKKGRTGEQNAMSRPEIKIKHKEKMKALSGKNIFSVFGEKNPSSKKLQINGKIFTGISYAAEFYGVHRETVRNWLKVGKPNSKYDILSISFIR